MDHPRYIEYILTLKTFFQINNYPLEIIQIIIMSIYRDIDIGSGSCSSHLIFYDRMCPKFVYEYDHISAIATQSFRQLRFEEPVKSIASGIIHRICLTIKGNVYSWGNNCHGQLGLADDVTTYFPQKIQLFNISTINCGSHYTIAYGNGILYGWGHNSSGQLGLGDHNSKNKPTALSFFRKDILQINCGASHTICLDLDHNIIGWGNNEFGQLCIGNLGIFACDTPREITFFKEKNIKIISVKCGQIHTIFLTSSKEIYVCGSNHVHQLGLFTGSSFSIPQKLKMGFDGIKEIECGEFYSAILTASNKLYIYGFISDNSACCQAFGDISNIKKVKCGSGYMVVLTDNNIYVWVSDNMMKSYPGESIL